MAARKNAKVLTEREVENEYIRQRAENSLIEFIRLIAPHNVMGSVHEELCLWMTRSDAKAHQLILMPRDHGKSRYAAWFALWELTRNPAIRILYISSTSTLAEKQLGFIKDIMQSSKYRKYWPEMTNANEGERKRWTTTEIAVDHPARTKEGIRDPSIMIAGLTTNIVGLHFDLVVMDDVVTGENAYTEEGRTKVSRQYSFLASIEAADAREVIVGTRYHPKDLYDNILNMKVEIFDDNGTVIDQEEVYEVFERKVEDHGDGSGQFLWPRQQREDGKWFGFDQKILATKKAKYIDKTQFYAQYYNNPNNSENAAITRDLFQYYEPTHLKRQDGKWFLKGKRLNVIAAADFGYTIAKRSDYTAVVVLGIDSDRNYYILDIDRYKTKSIKEQYEHLMNLITKWDFKKLIVETGHAGAEPIVEELKNSYFKPNGIFINIEPFKTPRSEGTKEERLRAILEPRYQNKAVWHYRGGNCQVLEDELVLLYPPHDDCKDAVANAMEKITAPSYGMSANFESNVIQFSPRTRFGGTGGGPRTVNG